MQLVLPIVHLQQVAVGLQRQWMQMESPRDFSKRMEPHFILVTWILLGLAD